MKICGNAVAINAKGALKQLANQNKWQQFEWRV